MACSVVCSASMRSSTSVVSGPLSLILSLSLCSARFRTTATVTAEDKPPRLNSFTAAMQRRSVRHRRGRNWMRRTVRRERVQSAVGRDSQRQRQHRSKCDEGQEPRIPDSRYRFTALTTSASVLRLNSCQEGTARRSIIPCQSSVLVLPRSTRLRPTSIRT
jgi:hypothetical protein